MISAPLHIRVYYSSLLYMGKEFRMRSRNASVNNEDLLIRSRNASSEMWANGLGWFFLLQLNTQTQRSSYSRRCSYRRLGTLDEEHRVSGGFASLGSWHHPYYCSSSFPDRTPGTRCCGFPAAGGMKVSILTQRARHMWKLLFRCSRTAYRFDWPVMPSTMGQDVSFQDITLRLWGSRRSLRVDFFLWLGYYDILVI